MKKFSLTALGREQLSRAGTEHSGRSAETVFGGHEQTLRQTVIALCKGHALNDHITHDEATVYVMAGRIRLTAGSDDWIGRDGDLLVVSDTRHRLDALEDSTILLTVAKKA